MWKMVAYDGTLLREYLLMMELSLILVSDELCL